jgi:hypothetical protein
MSIELWMLQMRLNSANIKKRVERALYVAQGSMISFIISKMDSKH